MGSSTPTDLNKLNNNQYFKTFYGLKIKLSKFRLPGAARLATMAVVQQLQLSSFMCILEFLCVMSAGTQYVPKTNFPTWDNKVYRILNVRLFKNLRKPWTHHPHQLRSMTQPRQLTHGPRMLAIKWHKSKLKPLTFQPYVYDINKGKLSLQKCQHMSFGKKVQKYKNAYLLKVFCSTEKMIIIRQKEPQHTYYKSVPKNSTLQCGYNKQSDNQPV